MAPTQQMERRHDDSRLRAAEAAAAEAKSDAEKAASKIEHHEELCSLRYAGIEKAMLAIREAMQAAHVEIKAQRERAEAEARVERRVMAAGFVVLALLFAGYIKGSDLVSAAGRSVGVTVQQPR